MTCGKKAAFAAAGASLCLMWSALAFGAVVADMTVQDFIRPSEFADVQLSPDGRFLSALVPRLDAPYENMLAVIDTVTGKPLSSLRAGSRNQILEYRWVNDHRVVIALATRLGSLESPEATGELLAFDADGTHDLYLFGVRGRLNSDSNHIRQGALRRSAYATLLSSAPSNDERHLLVQTQPFTDAPDGSVPSIESLDVTNGESRRVIGAPAHDVTMVLDHTGEPRAAISEAFSDQRLWTRDRGGEWMIRNDIAKSKEHLDPLGFNRDNSRLYVNVSHEKGPDSIESMDIHSGERTLVYQGTFANPGKLLATADGLDFYGVVTRDGKQGVHYLDKDSREAQISEALAASFPDQLVRLTSFTRDGNLAVVHVSSDRNPGDFYLFDLSQKQARYLFSSRRWLSPKQMRPMQPIVVTARDGVTLHGFLTTPEGKGPFPMVILPHGGPHGVSDSWTFDEEVQLLAHHGYAVLQVNYRGSSGYGDAFQLLGFRQWGLSMQDDLTDATQWAIREGHADGARLCIYGASYGGYAALEGAVREPSLYRCAVGYAGVYDLRIQLRKSDIQRTTDGLDYLHAVLGNDPDELLKRSPLAGVDRIQAKLLLIHGGMDERVPYANFKVFTSALDKQKKPYETLTKSHEGHGFFLQEHQREMYDKLIDFLDRNIGQSNSATTAASH